MHKLSCCLPVYTLSSVFFLGSGGSPTPSCHIACASLCDKYVSIETFFFFLNSLWEAPEQELCNEVLYIISTIALFSDAVTWYFHDIDHVLWQYKTTDEIT